MRKFKRGDREQLLVLPPSLNDWLPEDHLARFILEVLERLDLSKFYAVYESKRGGQPPYDPAVILGLLLYAYTTGNMSSRRIEQATWTDIACRFIAANLHPDHDTIAYFRKRHALLIVDTFAQIVEVAMKAKMVRLGHVSLDGTKVRANASKSKRRTQSQLERERDETKRLFGELLEEAELVDAEEDDEFGKGNKGDSLPTPLKTKEKRLQVIEEAIKALQEQQAEQKEEDPTGIQKHRRELKKGKPEVSKINTTDTDSRTMRFSNGLFDEGYNTQIVVDDEAGIIIAADATQEGGDKRLLLPMILQVEKNTGWLPDNVTADTGYYNESHIRDPRLKTVEFFVKPAKKKTAKPTTRVKPDPFSDVMRERLETGIGQALYHLRMRLVEPVFGSIKHARGFRQLLLRGLQGAKTEWTLICSAHNILAMFSRSSSLTALLS